MSFGTRQSFLLSENVRIHSATSGSVCEKTTLGLESESIAISKRMSATSMSTTEDGTLQQANRTQRKYQPRSSESSSRSGGRVTPSGIPRPSLSYARPLADSSSYNYYAPSRALSKDKDGANAKGHHRPQQRSRTLSQPFALDFEMGGKGAGGKANGARNINVNALPTPASSRSNSPSSGYPNGHAHNHSTNKMPVASGSKVSDHGHIHRGRERGRGRTTPTYDQPFRAEEAEAEEEDECDYEDEWCAEGDGDGHDHVIANASRSTVDVDVPHQNGIFEESAPFTTANSSAVYDEPEVEEEDDIRPSMEERPFEHWYRGDVSRNGGVGELRIGNRMEMLEIANFGHRLRNQSIMGRRRTQSIGARESMLIDEEETVAHPLVLDEAPLTDMEVDTETDREQSATRSYTDLPRRANYGALQQASNGVGAGAGLPSTPKAPRQPSQIPRAAPVAAAARSTQRTASEPLQAMAAASTSQIPPTRSRSQARIPHSHQPQPTQRQQQQQSLQTPASPAAQKRGRTKSPAGITTPAKKRPAGAAAHQKRSKSAAALGVRIQPWEVAEYPEVPDGAGSMADAIPSWTQPKKAGNWDDVSTVLSHSSCSLI